MKYHKNQLLFLQWYCSSLHFTQANIDWYAYKRIRERKCVNICSGNASIGIFNSYLSRQPLMQCKKKKNDSDHNLLFLQLVFFCRHFLFKRGHNWHLKAFLCLQERNWVPVSLIYPRLTVILAPTPLTPPSESPHIIMSLSDRIKVLPSITLCT